MALGKVKETVDDNKETKELGASEKVRKNVKRVSIIPILKYLVKGGVRKRKKRSLNG